jgi:hypothetical protein
MLFPSAKYFGLFSIFVLLKLRGRGIKKIIVFNLIFSLGKAVM